MSRCKMTCLMFFGVKEAVLLSNLAFKIELRRADVETNKIIVNGKVQVLCFADDLDVSNRTHVAAINALTSLRIQAERIGLMIKHIKTEPNSVANQTRRRDHFHFVLCVIFIDFVTVGLDYPISVTDSNSTKSYGLKSFQKHLVYSTVESQHLKFVYQVKKDYCRNLPRNFLFLISQQ